MRWFVQTGRKKNKSISFANFMANELIDASNNSVSGKKLIQITLLVKHIKKYLTFINF